MLIDISCIKLIALYKVWENLKHLVFKRWFKQQESLRITRIILLEEAKTALFIESSRVPSVPKSISFTGIEKIENKIYNTFQNNITVNCNTLIFKKSSVNIFVKLLSIISKIGVCYTYTIHINNNKLCYLYKTLPIIWEHNPQQCLKLCLHIKQDVIQ